MSGNSFQDFLNEQLEPKPPTAKQLEWAKKNFSSRVDPPVDAPAPTPVEEDPCQCDGSPTP